MKFINSNTTVMQFITILVVERITQFITFTIAEWIMQFINSKDNSVYYHISRNGHRVP